MVEIYRKVGNKLRNKNETINIENVLVYFYIILSPLQSTVFDSVINSAYVNLFFSIMMTFILIYKKKFFLKEYDKNTILLYLMPLCIATINSIVAYINLSFDDKYLEYLSSDLFNRWLTTSTTIIIFIFIVYKINSGVSNKKIAYRILRIYYIITGVIVFLGLWQFLSKTFGIPFLNIKSRDYVHSVQETNLVFNFRLTSILREPSFFVPFIVEFFYLNILILKIKKLKWMLGVLSVIIFLLTMSGSAFIELVFIFLALFPLLNIKKMKIGLFLFFGGLIVSALSFKEFLLKLLLPITDRISNFSMYSSTRIYIWINIFYYSIKDGLLLFFFGHGPNSFKYLGSVEKYPDVMEWWGGQYLEPGSNNYLVDAIYELGIIGFIFWIIIFTREIKYFYRKRKIGRQYLVGYFMAVHLVASSVYRGDYAAPRFFVLMIILSILKKENKE